MMKLGFARSILALVFLLWAAAAAWANDFPNRPVNIVVAFPTGGTADLLARMLSQRLSEEWKQTVVVENRPGASGIIGSQFVANAAPNGHTLLVVPITHVTNSSLFAKVPYDPLEDFTPITRLASQPMLLVAHPAQPFKTVGELVEYAKANPGKLNCASGGNGTSQHLACEMFKHMTGVQITHVPYRGNAPAMTDVMGGQVEIMFDQMATAVPHVRQGRVRALGVTALERSPAMPDVPTVAESGVPGFETLAWFGLLGPAKMPAELVTKINASIRKVLSTPEVTRNLGDLGLALQLTSPEEWSAYQKSEMERWGQVIKAAGIRLD